MPLAAKRVLSFVSLPLLCLFSTSNAGATVFRDRAAFEAAAQNLHTLDFESVPSDFSRMGTLDGVNFQNPISGVSAVSCFCAPGKVLFAGGFPEISVLYIYLPPGTTAVGLDQFSRPMEVLTTTGRRW